VRGGLSLENVVDMLENARRRIADQGRYDDGVARLYRCVEMWHQWRLGERSISKVKVDWEKLDEKVRKQFLEEAELNEPPRVLALHHARLLDHILDGKETEDEAVLRDLLQKRNHSILAHGLEPIEKKSTGRFLEYVDALVEAPEARVGAEHARLRGL
jgi:CRISPR-associated protein (TIGR02710 family)